MYELEIWVADAAINSVKWSKKKKFWKKKKFENFFFPSLNIHQAKSGVKNFSLYRGGGGGLWEGRVPPKNSYSKLCKTHFGFGIFEI